MIGKLVLLATAAALAAPFAAAHAQTEASANSMARHIDVGAEYSRISPDYWGRNLTTNGFSGYAEYTLQSNHLGAGLNSEYRTLSSTADFGRQEQSYLIGPKMDYRFGRYLPYFKFDAGLGHFDTAGTPPPGQIGMHTVLAPSFGLDIRLSRRLTVRAFDYEQQLWRFAPNNLSPTALSFGVSYRIR